MPKCTVNFVVNPRSRVRKSGSVASNGPSNKLQMSSGFGIWDDETEGSMGLHIGISDAVYSALLIYSRILDDDMEYVSQAS